MGAVRRKHTVEFKFEAVRLVTERGVSVARAARDLGIDRGLLAKWKRELAGKGAAAFPGKGRLRPLEDEVAGLRREIFEYIEIFYNGIRRHSTLGDVSPREFERQALAA